MTVIEILGAGAMGLGFLLAYLTYRLLAENRTNNRPIYAYQVFCFLLVLVGAFLQYSSMGSTAALDIEVSSLKQKVVNLEQKLDKVNLLQTRYDDIKKTILDWRIVDDGDRKRVRDSIEAIQAATSAVIDGQ